MEFDTLQNILQGAIADSRQRDAHSLSDRSYKLALSDAFFCGEDTVRNKKFYEAIGKAIADIQIKFPSDRIRVIDAGSGT